MTAVAEQTADAALAAEPAARRRRAVERRVAAQPAGPAAGRRQPHRRSNELETALSRQAESGQRLGETLLELGFVTEEELLPFIESQLGVPAVRLREGLARSAGRAAAAAARLPSGSA